MHVDMGVGRGIRKFCKLLAKEKIYINIKKNYRYRLLELKKRSNEKDIGVQKWLW